jgi:outer membrane protein assembly factor BamB
MRNRWLVALLVAAGCGGGNAFTNLFPDNRESDVDAVLARLPAARETAGPDNAFGRPVVVASRAEGAPGLAALDVSSGTTLWARDVVVDSQPFVGGGAVVFRSGDDLVSLSLRDGEELGSRSLDGLTPYGVAFDGGRVAVTAGQSSGSVAASYRTGTIWLLDEWLGNVMSPIDVDKQLGAPALSGDVLFVPWDRQNISALDVRTGAELCRLVVRDEMVGWLFAVPEGVFYGSKGVFRFTRGAASGTREGSAYAPIEWADPPFPGEPELWPDGFAGMGDGRPSAKAKARLAWYPGAASGDAGVAFADDLLYVVYYRYVVALRPADRELVWVRGLTVPAAEVAASPGGIWVVHESGAVRFLRAADGADGWTGEFGFPVARAGFSVAGHRPAGGAPQEGDVRRQVMDALVDTDNQAVPVRRLILSLYGRSTNPEVSRDLLALLRDPSIPDEMRNAAAQALRLRQDGATWLMQALEDHYDFLHDMPAPPIGVIAGALMNMNARSAASKLVEHLFDPATPIEDLEELVRSIVAIGDAAVVEPLQKFLRVYRADSELQTSQPVLEATAMGILVHGGEAGERFVEELAGDRFTPSVLADALRAMLDAHRAGAAGAASLPPALAPEEFASFMDAHRADFAPCIDDAARRRPRLDRFQVSVTLTGGGIVVDVSTEPTDNAFTSCLKPKLEALDFPRFQAQQDRFVVPIELAAPRDLE